MTKVGRFCLEHALEIEAFRIHQAAQAMAARLKAAGFQGEDIHIFETAPKRGNLAR